MRPCGAHYTAVKSFREGKWLFRCGTTMFAKGAQIVLHFVWFAPKTLCKAHNFTILHTVFGWYISNWRELMSYRTRIREAKPGLSKSYAKLADFILDSYIETSFLTATELAKKLELDAATVVRFSQRLGYPGYPQLLSEIREHVKNDLLVRPQIAEDPGTIPGILANAMGELKNTLDQTQATLNTDAIQDLTRKIGTSRRIIILAEGPAQPAAYNLVYFLEQADFPVHIARPGLAGLSRMIHTATPQDLIIALDVAREAPYIAPALREARAKGITTAAIVGSPSLASANSATIVLAARANPDMGIAIITIEAIIYALVKALRVEYADRFAGAERAISDLSSMFV